MRINKLDWVVDGKLVPAPHIRFKQTAARISPNGKALAVYANDRYIGTIYKMRFPSMWRMDDGMIEDYEQRDDLVVEMVKKYFFGTGLNRQ